MAFLMCFDDIHSLNLLRTNLLVMDASGMSDVKL